MCAALLGGAVTAAVGLTVLVSADVGCQQSVGGDIAPGDTQQRPDGTARVLPASVSGVVGALLVLAAVALILTRRADPPSLLTAAQHALWLAVLMTAVPGLLWSVAALSSTVSFRGLWGLAATAFACLPLVTSYVRPTIMIRVLAGCLIVPVTGVTMGVWLPLLLPIAVPVAGMWLIAWWLAHTAHRIKSDTGSGGRSTADSTN
ncbi:adenylate cyclase [Mangrovihabitans endophyticus]|uniref:Uncharacterized protein n=1 Tax=Mangrovihabitans endophyticus TaxID=1751298 RepID=A0A8J3BZF0_9ACTN|nr:adenylate cyclase [Mangrovihabitans endophyticus]GGK87473.1 hypothetical protein GCM10012284_21930 [Mangrovihabitans endophyticus]